MNRYSESQFSNRGCEMHREPPVWFCCHPRSRTGIPSQRSGCPEEIRRRKSKENVGLYYYLCDCYGPPPPPPPQTLIPYFRMGVPGHISTSQTVSFSAQPAGSGWNGGIERPLQGQMTRIEISCAADDQSRRGSRQPPMVCGLHMGFAGLFQPTCGAAIGNNQHDKHSVVLLLLAQARLLNLDIIPWASSKHSSVRYSAMS
ncbi:hypothetical protein M426DRAFT_256826 [Hypoxylon sp. CI-4A]|nr:hypothetical protein M426DRAFT_256826 [Hypoxylon sp. CI-4A]